MKMIGQSMQFCAEQCKYATAIELFKDAIEEAKAVKREYAKFFKEKNIASIVG